MTRRVTAYLNRINPHASVGWGRYEHMAVLECNHRVQVPHGFAAATVECGECAAAVHEEHEIARMDSDKG